MQSSCLEYQKGLCVELIACASWHLGNQLGLLTKVPHFSSLYFFMAWAVQSMLPVFQRGVSEAEKLETADILSPILKVA